jgi:DNA-binding NarL/FixJ family response regulator
MATHEVGVSAREAEVLAAIGEHLTNAEIAARLFISVRTVESHVSSMLRKLQVEDRRALAAIAARLPAADPGDTGKIMVPLPAPLTSFVGRSAERAALTSVVRGHRMVTAVGPGGVGKTRLVLSVLTGLAGEFADGVWFVDLVPIAHPSMIAPAIAAALGLGEDEARSAEDTVADWLAVRETLLVLDNCEHLLDGVAVVVERLLAGCPQLRVLITSRAGPYQAELAGDWAAAAQQWQDLGCPYDAALALLDAPDEAALRTALDLLTGLGAEAAAQIARQRLRSLGVRSIPAGPRAATRADPLRLTQREREVLGLICAGLSNAEIAAQLFISVKTAGHHVSAILAKLDAPTRHAAAIRAAELGLTGVPAAR